MTTSEPYSAAPQLAARDGTLTYVSALINASAAQVFAVLADGWAYAGWVVGATHIRDVDLNWPEPGSKIHHRIGAWPLTLSDETESLACDADRLLVLRANGWPLGQATVQLALEPKSANQTVVSIGEAPTAGIAKRLDSPPVRWALTARNKESLARLRSMAEHRESSGT